MMMVGSDASLLCCVAERFSSSVRTVLWFATLHTSQIHHTTVHSYAPGLHNHYYAVLCFACMLDQVAVQFVYRWLVHAIIAKHACPFTTCQVLCVWRISVFVSGRAHHSEPRFGVSYCFYDCALAPFAKL